MTSSASHPEIFEDILSFDPAPIEDYVTSDFQVQGNTIVVQEDINMNALNKRHVSEVENRSQEAYQSLWEMALESADAKSEPELLMEPKIEPEQSEDEPEDPGNDVDNDPDYYPGQRAEVRPVRTSGRKRKMTAKAENGYRAKQSRISDDILLNPDGTKSGKLYMSKPFADPKKEKARQNAVNAKRNRDRKKKEEEARVRELAQLREAAMAGRIAEQRLEKFREAWKQNGFFLLYGNPECSVNHNGDEEKKACDLCVDL